MKLLLCLSVFAFLFSSCTNKAESNQGSDFDFPINEKEIDRSLLLDISEFNIDSTALSDKEQIKLICASETLFPTDMVNYFIHAVAVSLETGDTVNILATGVIDVTKNHPYGEFLSPNSDLAKVLQNMDKIEDNQNIHDLEVSDFDKVYTDPKFINIETAHFPAIIGMVGKVELTY